jgi:hypothetical protein
MNEGPPIPHEEEHLPVGRWNPNAIGEALGARPHQTADLFFGEGAGYTLGPNRTTQIALYPEHKAVEVTTPEVIITMRRPTELTTLAVSRDGTTTLTSAPVPTADFPAEERKEPGRLPDLQQQGDPGEEAPAE